MLMLLGHLRSSHQAQEANISNGGKYLSIIVVTQSSNKNSLAKRCTNLWMIKCTCCDEIKASLAHIKLAHELRKDAKEGLCVGCFAIFSKVRGSFAEFLQSSLLQRLQRLNCRMSVFQEVLHTPGSRDTNASSSLTYNCSFIVFVWQFLGRIHS